MNKMNGLNRHIMQEAEQNHKSSLKFELNGFCRTNKMNGLNRHIMQEAVLETHNKYRKTVVV